MANNYLQFSEELPNLTKKEVKWFKEKLENLQENEIIINYAIEKNDENNTKLWKLWFYSEGYGDIEEIAKLIHIFFKEFRSNQNNIFTLTWSEYCDKLRVGEFGGGFVFVCKDYYTIKNVGDLLHEEIQKNKKIIHT